MFYHFPHLFKNFFVIVEDCTEPVLWIVYEKKIAISEAQLSVYRRLLSTPFTYDGNDGKCSHNFRPLHPLNPPVSASRKLNYRHFIVYTLIDHFTGQATSTRILFLRQYDNFIEELIPSLLGTLIPSLLGTGATFGACEYWKA